MVVILKKSHKRGGALTNPKKNGDLMLRVRYDSGAELAGPAVITDEGALLVSLGGAASMLVQRAMVVCRRTSLRGYTA